MITPSTVMITPSTGLTRRDEKKDTTLSEVSQKKASNASLRTSALGTEGVLILSEDVPQALFLSIHLEDRYFVRL